MAARRFSFSTTPPPCSSFAFTESNPLLVESGHTPDTGSTIPIPFGSCSTTNATSCTTKPLFDSNPTFFGAGHATDTRLFGSPFYGLPILQSKNPFGPIARPPALSGSSSTTTTNSCITKPLFGSSHAPDTDLFGSPAIFLSNSSLFESPVPESKNNFLSTDPTLIPFGQSSSTPASTTAVEPLLESNPTTFESGHENDTTGSPLSSSSCPRQKPDIFELLFGPMIASMVTIVLAIEKSQVLISTWMFLSPYFKQFILFIIRILNSLSSTVSTYLLIDTTSCSSSNLLHPESTTSSESSINSSSESESESQSQSSDASCSCSCSTGRRSKEQMINEEAASLTSEHSSFTSDETDESYNLSHASSANPTSLKSPPVSDFNRLFMCLEETLSQHNLRIVKQIFLKHGDIAKESILKSVEAKANFFKLVAEVVELLYNNKLDIDDIDEVLRIQSWINDAAAVGYRVDWLRKRVSSVLVDSKYRESLARFKEMGEEISVARAALKEMEVQHWNLKKDVDLMEAEMDGYDCY